MIVDRLRQRRLRRHRPAAGQPGRGVVQQPARRLRAPPASWCPSTSPPTPRRWAARAERVATIAELERRRSTRARRRRPHDGDRHRHRSARLDRGRSVVGGRRPRGERPAVDPRGPGGARRGQGRAAGGDLAMADVVRIGVLGCGRIGRMHAELLARRVAGVELVAVHDVVPTLAATLAAQLGVPALDSADDVLAAGVDAVAICTSHRHPRRADHGRRGGRRGDLLREADLPRPRRGRRRAGRRRRRRRARSTSGSTAASIRPTRSVREAVGVGRARAAAPACGSPAATRRRRRSATSSAPAGCSST